MHLSLYRSRCIVDRFHSRAITQRSLHLRVRRFLLVYDVFTEIENRSFLKAQVSFLSSGVQFPWKCTVTRIDRSATVARVLVCLDSITQDHRKPEASERESGRSIARAFPPNAGWAIDSNDSSIRELSANPGFQEYREVGSVSTNESWDRSLRNYLRKAKDVERYKFRESWQHQRNTSLNEMRSVMQKDPRLINNANARIIAGI